MKHIKWYWFLLIIPLAFFVVTFTIYITNADMKLVSKIYDKLMAYHDSKEKEEKL